MDDIKIVPGVGPIWKNLMTKTRGGGEVGEVFSPFQKGSHDEGLVCFRTSFFKFWYLIIFQGDKGEGGKHVDIILRFFLDFNFREG